MCTQLILLMKKHQEELERGVSALEAGAMIWFKPAICVCKEFYYDCALEQLVCVYRLKVVIVIVRNTSFRFLLRLNRECLGTAKPVCRKKRPRASGWARA